MVKLFCTKLKSRNDSDYIWFFFLGDQTFLMEIPL